MNPNNLYLIFVKIEHSSNVISTHILLNVSVPGSFPYLDIYILDCILNDLQGLVNEFSFKNHIFFLSFTI